MNASVADSFLPTLKRFQRKTVEHVFNRFYLDADATDRFLVADEVGLGKTLVAAGVVAKAIDHLRAGRKRIDVVYVCSNQVIAHQNVGKLMKVVRTGETHKPVLDRVTMLPAHVHQLEKHELNLIPLTPQTSLDLRSNVGARRERALLWHLLAHELDRGFMSRSGPRRVLQGPCRTLDSFDRGIAWDVDPTRIDKRLRSQFLAVLRRDRADRKEESLLATFDRLSDEFKYKGALRDWDLVDERNRLIGDLRRALARSCIDAMEPDIVILDEFQRFRDLLDPDHPAGELADLLFAHPDAKVLLLSATPYKMLTRDVEASEEDHYSDFINTLRFLFERDEEAVERCRWSLGGLRRGLRTLHDGGQPEAAKAKRALEKRLRKVIARTERLAVTGDRNGMVRPAASDGLILTPFDVRSFVELDRVARTLGAHDAIEYWKSSPYPLNFMDAYVLSDRFVDRARSTKAARVRYGALDAEAVRDYEAIDPGNARVRALIHDTVERGMWKLLWLPPSLPYHHLGRPFGEFESSPPTKRLIFSAWTVVPKAIACLVSYEAERRLVSAEPEAGPKRNTPAERRKISQPLRFARRQAEDGREEAASLTTFALLYPSSALAELGDPLRIAAEAGTNDGERLSARAVLGEIERKLSPLVRELRSSAPRKGAEDVAWYTAAPILLDAALEQDPCAWLSSPDVQLAVGVRTTTDGETPEDSSQQSKNWVLHVERALELADRERLGRPPRDLRRVLALLALASPAVCARRALARVAPSASEERLRLSALEVADGLRGLFNQPEVIPLIRATAPTTRYWEDALRYSANGCLQAVLDEYAHVLSEWAPISEPGPDAVAKGVADAMIEALSLRAPDYEVRQIDGRGIPKREPLRMHSRFALRFADPRSGDEGQVERASSVRASFNSPFWPFVLATTSVGQEGLDFHLYCHAVVHWNLPANPVDFEQREGRVHRYKGHAVRLNLAHLHGHDAFKKSVDPWAAMFAAAEHRDGDLRPYWILNEGPARILRFVPALPWSRDIARQTSLERLLGCYRLAFGQPRQDDLLAYLGELELDEHEVNQLVIDLSPRRRR